MTKWFNITGPCIPEDHYMVDMSRKLEEIKEMVDRRFYFTINRGRQYGKTTTLTALESYLADDYTIISLSFQGMGDASFACEEKFCQEFLTAVSRYLEWSGLAEGWLDETVVTFSELSRHITKRCQDKKMVLMIDEVDQASNHRVFLNFLGILRDKFILRSKKQDFTFHSVILAGVYDIKNIKLKMIQEGLHALTSREQQYNSPWNIAARFKVALSFSAEDIAGMLSSYEADDQTGMAVRVIAEDIYFYTNGYPVLVSSICRYVAEELEKNWTVAGVREAVKRLVRETDNELFKSLSQNLEGNDSVHQLLYDVLILGVRRSFSVDNSTVSLAYRYGYIQDVNGLVNVANKIFEIRMTDYFISKDEERMGGVPNGGFISEVTRDGRFQMDLCLKRFLVHWQEIYTEQEGKFIENQCRIIFLTYLKPILNGVGFSFIETALTDDRRMDLVVIYNNERFVLELKTWKGQRYNEQGVAQLLGYMDKVGEEKGYLLTFDFRKNPKFVKPQWVDYEGRQIFEARVQSK